MGFEANLAAGVLTWANVGGATGGAIFGLAATRIGLRKLTIFTLFISSGMIMWFGRGAGDIVTLSAIVAIAGLFTNRSEEHTSELQSLMRLSYAVFCLKKKKAQK